MNQPAMWLQVILLGGVLGMFGQVARVVVGMKKAMDEAAQKKVADSSVIDSRRLVVSLVIGFAAGGLGALAVLPPGAAVTTETLLGLATAGYAGTDFIEGFMKRQHLSGSQG